MPRSSQRKPKTSYEPPQHSQKLERIDLLLQDHLTYFPAKGTLTPDEIEHWHKDLAPFSLEAIEYAFDCHRRSAIFFPIYGNILDICMTYDPPAMRAQNTCDAICKARHGKGYGKKDMLWMYGKMCEDVKAGRPINSEALLAELDSKREAGAPEWRETE